MNSTQKNVVILSLAALGLWACNGKTGNAPAGPGPNPASIEQTPPVGWKLFYKTACPAEVKAQDCIGAHGITVNENGEFVVGPAPDGQTWSGSIPQGTLEQLRASLQTVNAGERFALEGDTPCDTLEQDSPRGEWLSYSRGGGFVEVSRLEGKTFCHRGGELAASLAFHRLVGEIARSNYPLPFPSDCLNTARAIEPFHEAVSGCETDADCVYLNNSLEPIPQGTVGYVSLDDCTWIKPLSVANPARIGWVQAKLQATIQEIRQACGAQLQRGNCSGPRGIQATSAHPVCDAGVCRVNPLAR